jgi:hypothetical protein
MAKGATRGQPSGGDGPYYNNYLLGNDPNWLGNFAQQGQSLNQAAQDTGNMGQQAGQVYAGRANDLSVGYGARGDAAAGRATPATAYDPGLAAAQTSNAQGGAAQYGLAQQLAGMAAAPQGPSAAQAQLRKGTDAALNANFAMARSGSGFGESSNALDTAGRNAAATTAGAANDSAVLKANEDQAYRQNQANLLGLSGQALTAARSGDSGLAQQMAQQGQFNTTAALQQTGLNDQAAASLYGQQLQGQQQALQANQFATQSQQQAIAQQQAEQQNQLSAAQAQQQGTTAYESGLNDVYATDQQHNIDARRLDQSRDKDRVSGVGQAIGAIAGMVGLSDRRSKTRVSDQQGELSHTYRALGGDSGGLTSDGVITALSDRHSKERIDQLEGELQKTYAALGGQTVTPLDENPYGESSVPVRRAVDREAPEDVGPMVVSPREAALLGDPAPARKLDRENPYRPVGSYSYDYKDPSMPGAEPGRQSGPMADELRGLPGVVKQGPNGMDYVDEGRLTMNNASELGSQRRELDELRRRLEALGGAVSTGSPDDRLRAAQGAY